MLNHIRTKIIATVGPASESGDMIARLVEAGVSVFRINSSHGTQEKHLEKINSIRTVAGELNCKIPIILDLQGPKIRVGNLKNPIKLEQGQSIVLKSGKEQGEEDFIPVDYDDLYKNLNVEDVILLDDGKLQLKITASCQEIIEATVINGGILSSRKGVNIPGSTLNVPSVTPKDIEYIKFGVDNDIDYIALSFVRRKEDINLTKDYIKHFGGDIPVIAKIEKPEALNNLEEIIGVSDGIMVARGDLGIEISPQRVPIVQKHIIKLTNAYRKEVITATQMLESMMHEPIPTRAEASDVANAIIDGTDAVMLSGETAVGEFPVETVKIMRSIAENVENSNLCHFNNFEPMKGESCGPESQAIANAAIRMIDEVQPVAIVAFTRTGFTAGLISNAKPSVPVVAFTDSSKVCTRLNLLWGVYPYYMEFSPNFTEDFIRKTDNFLIANTFLQKGDKIIITGGMPCLATGTTNFIRIHEIGAV